MSEMEKDIYNCLKMFGPCEIRTIQQKLDQLGLIFNQDTIDTIAENMVELGLIKEATGFNDKAYKV